MKDYKKDFIEFLIEEDILLFGDFITKSKRNSPYFINLGLCNTGKRLSKLSSAFVKCMEAKKLWSFTTLYGPAYKGIALVASITLKLYEEQGRNYSFCYNRKQRKNYGEGGILVGVDSFESTDRLLLVDDVITAGTSLRETIDIMKSHGSPFLKDMLIAVDRMEIISDGKTAVNHASDMGVSVYSIVNIKEIIKYCYDQKIIDDVILENIQKYWNKYGVKDA